MRCQVTASVYSPPAVSRCRKNETDEKSLSDWLITLPKPCGVMAAFDQRAKNVLDACRLAQIAVPEQIAVLGVDNEEYLCENTYPSLSSILPDFNDGGFRAAELLNRFISGDLSADGMKITYGVKKIEERASTADVRGMARSVALACEFIRKNAESHIGMTMSACRKAART